MKQPDSNPLRKELARSQQAESHLDSDMLTAFAEGSLLARERESVLEHLAICAQCREVLSIATDAAPEPVAEGQPLVRPVRPPLRSWLPWVAAAACVLVVSSALLLHEQMKLDEARSGRSSSVATKELAQVPAPLSQLPSPSEPKSATAPHRTPGSVVHRETTPRQQESSSAAAADSGAAFADAAPAPMVRGTATVESVRPHWRINDLGQLERSFGNGAWQPMPTHETSQLHVVSVFGSEVWAGGENLRLEHSSDNGATWESIQLPAKNGYNHAVAHIRFQTPQAGRIDSDDGTSWVTNDGGRTWK